MKLRHKRRKLQKRKRSNSLYIKNEKLGIFSEFFLYLIQMNTRTDNSLTDYLTKRQLRLTGYIINILDFGESLKYEVRKWQ